MFVMVAALSPFAATDAFAFVSLTEPVHRTLVFFHLVGVILFMGNIIVTAMWMSQARRTQNAQVLHFASRSLMRSDTIFTVPGILLILVPGLLTVGPWGGFPGASWAELGLAFFLLSGLIWLIVLLRLQKRMVRLSQEAVESSSELGEPFYRAASQWMMWGGIATLLPMATLYLMVYKPKLWG
jgi:uncharacterized membrane protein